MQRHRFTVQLHSLGATDLHHGDCQGGDKQAHDIARSLGLIIVGHPPKAAGLRAYCVCDEMREPRAFLTRNHAIVLETQILIATPSGPETLRSGTWATVRFARRQGLPRVIITPNGTVLDD